MRKHFATLLLFIIFAVCRAQDPANMLYVSDIETSPNGEAVMIFSLKNEVSGSITLWQTDVELPEGVTPCTDKNGVVLIKLSGTRTSSKRHDIGASIQPDGSLKVLCSSMNNYTFLGTDGEVARLTLNVGSLSAGDYPIVLKNILLAGPKQEKYTDEKNSTYTATLTVLPLPGDALNDGRVSVADVTAMVRLMNAKSYNKFADVNSDGVIDQTDIQFVVNYILER